MREKILRRAGMCGDWQTARRTLPERSKAANGPSRFRGQEREADVTEESQELELVEADAEQKIERDRHAYEAWGQRLTLEQFLAREVRLRAHPFAQESMRTWLLRGSNGRILSSCESFQTPCRVGARWGEAYELASVFTEASLRGRGHAVQLITKLVERLGTLPGRPLAVTLYSDVGAGIYGRCGFTAVATPHDWRLAPLSADPEALVDRLFEEGALATELAKVSPPSGSGVLLWPEAGQVDWQLERERIYAHLLDRPRLRACGAVAGDSRAFWAGNLKAGLLEVLLVEGSDPAELKALLRAAQALAAEAGLTQIRLWEDPAPAPWTQAAATLGAQRLVREGSLPMLAPLAAGVGAADWQHLPRALWV
jgi:GNAT superfamily N-acetyltransferase